MQKKDHYATMNLTSSKRVTRMLAIIIQCITMFIEVTGEQESSHNTDQYDRKPEVWRPLDAKQCGDLHVQKGNRAYSLAWVVQLKPKCNIRNIVSGNKIPPLYGYERTKKDSDYGSREFGARSYSKGHMNSDVHKYLFILKKIPPLSNTFVIAHMYFKFYSKVKGQRNNYYKRHLRSAFFQGNFSQYHEYLKSHNGTYRSRNTPVFNKIDTDEENYWATKSGVERYLSSHPCVKYLEQEVLRYRSKRNGVTFSDPLFSEQWHLHSNSPFYIDINVVPVWESGVTGRGVTVCVIDDGLEWKHPDLQDNYNSLGSYDLNAEDSDPSPVKNGERNEHGTRCAGEIAAVANSVCGVGVAYRAKISGIRVLGGRLTDSMEASAFLQGLDVNDIYSCSWGPDDDGKTVDGPHHLARQALFHGVTYGRKGYGAIYVVASGNGGRRKDDCNFDGYANSVYTMTIGAVDSQGHMPYYAEECAAMLAVTPSSGSNGQDIVTTDWREISDTGCTKHHSGTSAAAPLAAGIVALALEVQPCLSWRDVQYLIALSSKKIDQSNSDWIDNKAGLHHSHQHGFGLMDAAAMVSAAAVWSSVPFASAYSSRLMEVNLEIPGKGKDAAVAKYSVEKDLLTQYAVHLLEVVQVQVSITHEYRGSLKIVLICPSGTKSVLASPRDSDNSTEGLKGWMLSTVRCWGEEPEGTYELHVHNTHNSKMKGQLLSWQLVLHGTPMSPEVFQQRKRLVRAAINGHAPHVNRSSLCLPPEPLFDSFTPIPERWLKVVIITGFFLLFMIIYNTLEYIFCYHDEKEKFYKKLQEISVSQAMQHRRQQGPFNSSRQYGSIGCQPHRKEEEGWNIDDNDASGSAQTPDSFPLMVLDHEIPSPTPSCDADISSLNCDSDDVLSSHHTSDTILPKDTDATDFTHDEEFLSEVEDEVRDGSQVDHISSISYL